MKRLADAAAALALANLLFWRDWTNLITNVSDGGIEALYLGHEQRASAYLAIPGYTLLVAALLWFLLGRWRPERRPKAVKLAVILISMLCPFVLFTFGQCLVAAAKHGPTLSPSSPVKDAKLRRTLVLLFDEMDAGIFFQDEPGLLPALERARAESVSAEMAFSPHGCTLLSVPALLTGIPVTDARAVSESRLELTSPQTKVFLDGVSQLFSLARTAGSRTALVGYFHPYCRMFGSYVDWCRSFSSLEYEYGAVPWPLTFQGRDREALAHENNFRAARESLLSVVADPNFDFVYAHVPAPRPPGLDPDHRGYSETSYRANGRVVDRLFSEVRAKLEGVGLWDATNVIVTSDHGYRDSATALEPAGVSFRYRHVPFFVKLAGKAEPSAFPAPLSTLPFGSWILGLLKGEITEPSGLLERWKQSPFDARPVPAPANEYCKLPATPSRVQ